MQPAHMARLATRRLASFGRNQRWWVVPKSSGGFRPVRVPEQTARNAVPHGPIRRPCLEVRKIHGAWSRISLQAKHACFGLGNDRLGIKPLVHQAHMLPHLLADMQPSTNGVGTHNSRRRLQEPTASKGTIAMTPLNPRHDIPIGHGSIGHGAINQSKPGSCEPKCSAPHVASKPQA